MASGATPARAARWLVGGLVIGLGIGAAAYFALVATMPRYTATVLYHVAQGDAPGAPEKDPLSSPVQLQSYVAFQVETLTSDRILERVAEQPQVAETAWAQRYAGEEGLAPAAVLRPLREIVSARAMSAPGLFQLRVDAPNPDDALVLARAVDEVYRRDNLEALTRDAQGVLQHMEREIRSRRQDVAALDIRVEQLMLNRRVTGPVEESLPYQERARVIARLADARAELAALPGADEEGVDRETLDRRAALQVLADRLLRRVEALDERVGDVASAAAEVENLRAERVSKMESINRLSATAGDLAAKIERGTRVRVLEPAELPESRSFPPAPPIIGAGVLIGGLLGLVLGLARD